MEALIIGLFVVGYLAITLEHTLHLDKTVPAVIMASLMWAALSLGFNFGDLSVIDTHEHIFSITPNISETDLHHAEEGFVNSLLHHLGKTSEILIFLIGAMTIVELIDLHQGFEIIKGWVKTKSKKKLLWIICILAFILSAIIDNLTATIVLVTIIRKIMPSDKSSRLWFASMVVIAANAGGAWSPIGDVTTTMLWIAKKVSTTELFINLIIPSLVCMAVPTFIASLLPAFQGEIQSSNSEEESTQLLSSKKMLFLGLGAIVFVPVFKTLTHLPPYLGMMLSMGIVWMVSEYIHPEEDFTEERKKMYSPHKALARIEMSSILFFLGILMAVGALETLVTNGVGTLRYAAELLDKAVPSQDVVVILLGVGSAIIDNVPLVAASIGMYEFPLDDYHWHFIAYAAGTGGSMLIIGSAAGVAAMGMEKINFIWYLKKISWLAFLGFILGCVTFLVLYNIIHPDVASHAVKAVTH